MNKKFLNKVTDQLVRETEVDYVSKKVKLRFTSSYTYLDIVDAYIFPYPPFEEHLEGVYGLKNMSERKYVQNNYEDTINNMLNPKDNINESTGMDKKFLNKVVDQIVSETEISKRRSITEIRTPFSQRIFSAHDVSQGNDLNSRYSDVSALYHYFSIHCQNIYGLDSSEMVYAFQKYRNIIMLKINGVIESRRKENLNTITESKKGDKKISLSGKDKSLFYQAYQEMGMEEEWYENNLLEILDWLNGLPQETILYRLLYIGDDEKIDKEFLGDHYTPNKKELLYNHYNEGSIYGGNGGHPVLIKVKINKEQIDIFNTIHNNINFPHEEEITLKNKGKNVKIIDVTKL